MAENPYAHRYEVLEDGALATRPRPFWKRPELLFWPACGLLLFGVVATAVVVGLNKTDQPDCRKSSPLAVFTPESHPDSALRQRLCGHESLFLLYGGKGKQLEAYDDLWAMCTQSKKWTELVKDGHIHEKEPVLRWKMAHATGANGMYVMGGSEMIQDDYPPSAENGMKYFNDVWLYSVVEPVGWTLLHGGGIPEEGELPAPRRSHIGIVYTNSDGNELLVITGGRTSKDEVLNDVWEFDVASASWTCLASSVDGEGFPPSRKGAIAVAAPHATGDKPYLVMHGGRPAVGYYGDVWAFNLNSMKWEEWATTPTEVSASAPEPRDHHVGHYYNMKMYIHGGRGGIDHVWENSKQFSDLWEFDIMTKKWTELHPKGPKPIPRWLHTAAPFQTEKIPNIKPSVEEASAFVISGGEDVMRCYMNDVWKYDAKEGVWEVLQKCTFCQDKCRTSEMSFLP